MLVQLLFPLPNNRLWCYNKRRSTWNGLAFGQTMQAPLSTSEEQSFASHASRVDPFRAFLAASSGDAVITLVVADTAHVDMVALTDAADAAGAASAAGAAAAVLIAFHCGLVGGEC